MSSWTVDSKGELWNMDRRAACLEPDSSASLEGNIPETAEVPAPERDPASPALPFSDAEWTRTGPWSQSGAKRVFDCACVLLALPLLTPVLLALGLVVRLTSRGPALFMQRRTGRHGKTFTILKLRTMTHATDRAHHPITTVVNQRFTPIGPFLRRWKLDELPQLLNVLAGHMSLVGPRPKVPEHEVDDLPCRPGITGAATIAFAREEEALTRVPQYQLDAYYHALVLPAKRNLDAAYMARATFFSDFKLLVDTVLRRWNDSIMQQLLHREDIHLGSTILESREAVASRDVARFPSQCISDRATRTEEAATS